jgi:protein-S-isoprenylcysteine O-methyltransferase Ste14
MFFVVWSIDTLGYFLFRISTIVVESASLPVLLFPAILSWGFGAYLALKSHEAVFPEDAGEPRLLESGVYSWVRHPMYLGTFLFCLGFSFAIVSLLSVGILIGFFVFYDKMATYKEKDLVSKLGQEYTSYQERVPKWIPRLLRK